MSTSGSTGDLILISTRPSWRPRLISRLTVGMRDAELVGDLRLRQAFEEMQDQRLVHLPGDDDLLAWRWG